MPGMGRHSYVRSYFTSPIRGHITCRLVPATEARAGSRGEERSSEEEQQGVKPFKATPGRRAMGEDFNLLCVRGVGERKGQEGTQGSAEAGAGLLPGAKYSTQ